MEIITQNLGKHSSYDKYFVIMTERVAVKRAAEINKTCRQEKIGMRARSIFPGLVMEFGDHLEQYGID